MTYEHHEINDRMSRQIDRLVAAELSDEERRSLFEWCNAEPQRWRKCALAFLEVQAWQEGLASWDGAPEANRTAATVQLPTASAKVPRFDWKVLAVSVAVAFLCGILVRDPKSLSITSTKESATPQASQVADPSTVIKNPVAIRNISASQANYVNVSVRTNLSPNSLATLQIPVGASETSSRPIRSDLPDYVKKQWEKRGYQVATTERYLSGHLPDGSDVVVPVSGLEVKYVGKPVY
jgi:hypothetical protein